MSVPGNTTIRRPRRGSGAVTLHDVAKLAGVAPITASRALSKPSQVSADVLRKVTDAVNRTGYVRNVLAGGLASARSRLVAAVVPTIAGPVFLQTVQALTQALAERGYQLMLGQSGYVDSREDALLEAIIGRRPDGIVLTGVMHSAEGRRRLMAAGIPVVETWDLTPTPLDMLVGFSHGDVGARGGRDSSMPRGRKSLAVVSGDDERAVRRQAAFQEAARAAGLGPVSVVQVPAPTTLGSGRAALAELLERRPLRRCGVLQFRPARARRHDGGPVARHRTVPGRLAVVGFGDLDFAADLDPALTTVRIDGTAIGRQAAQFIVDRAEGREVAQRVVDVGFSIVEREST